jgi:hypothetical protein
VSVPPNVRLFAKKDCFEREELSMKDKKKKFEKCNALQDPREFALN